MVRTLHRLIKRVWKSRSFYRWAYNHLHRVSTRRRKGTLRSTLSRKDSIQGIRLCSGALRSYLCLVPPKFKSNKSLIGQLLIMKSRKSIHSKSNETVLSSSYQVAIIRKQLAWGSRSKAKLDLLSRSRTRNRSLKSLQSAWYSFN